MAIPLTHLPAESAALTAEDEAARQLGKAA